MLGFIFLAFGIALTPICWPIFLASVIILVLLEQLGIIQPQKTENWSGPSPRIANGLSFLISILIPFKSMANKAQDLKGKKVLFVCNHQLGGMEIPAICAAIWMQTGIYPRGLADRMHFLIPGWSQLFTIGGALNAERENCIKAMKAGQPLLVFPGGSDEVFRTRKIEPYTLLWKERKGFAKLALEHGYTIVPIASVGADEQLTIVYEMNAQGIMRLAGDKRKDREILLPLSLPNLNFQRIYIQIGAEIETSCFDSSDAGKDGSVTAIRDLTRDAIKKGIEETKRERDNDPYRYIGFARLRVSLSKRRCKSN